jgi:hypothetical protein
VKTLKYSLTDQSIDAIRGRLEELLKNIQSFLPQKTTQNFILLY